MKTKIWCLASILIFLLGSACTDNGPGPIIDTSRDFTLEELQLIAADNAFGFDLLKAILAEESDTNLFISPLSVSMSLGMAYNGAANDTRQAMHETLHFGDLSVREINENYLSLIELLTNLDNKVTFQIANSMWCRQGYAVLDSFIQANQEYFDASFDTLDFSSQDAVTTINNWVKSKTNNKIKEIVDYPINPLTVLFLINAIYFNGTWTYEFDQEATSSRSFYGTGDESIECLMMQQTGNLPYSETAEYQAVNLPYGDGRFSMVVLLPKAGIELNNLIQQLDPEGWQQMMAGFSDTELNLSLPKFKMEYEANLNDVLSALGMAVAFEPGDADFANINPDDDLFISKVKHKTYVDVYEEGTEAAAVTSVEVSLTAAPSSTVMNVNRPFLFAICERNSGAILFIGKVVAPTYES